jgi:hypothetical protein
MKGNMKKQPSQSKIINLIDNGHKKVTTWKQLHGLLENMRDTAWIFRGVASPLHYPIPSIGRENIFGPYKLAQEERLFNEFKKRAISLMPSSNFDDWHSLAYAQHIGVPTRLLDWSYSPLIALFFALESESDEDRVVYAFKFSQYIHEVEQNEAGPFKCIKEGRFSAPFAFDRIRAQRGLFTVHPNPKKIFYREGMKTILIPSNKVPDFRRRLYKYGIDPWHIYPDMQGLGQQLYWQYKNKVGLGQVFTSESKYA